MAIFEFEDFRTERPATAEATGIFHRVAEAVAQWRLRRRTIAELSHLDERQQRDVGFRSADTYDPTNGGARTLWRRALFGPDAPSAMCRRRRSRLCRRPACRDGVAPAELAPGANADVQNVPMAGAFARAGFRITEEHIVLTDAE